MLKDSLSHAPTVIRDKETAVIQHFDQQRQTAAQRFPLLFTMLTAFGLVATFYGFEGIIDRIGFLYDNPLVLLLLGVTVLGVTGTLYKKLG
jgi:hypothetical protein